jgi:hypothetical protein
MTKGKPSEMQKSRSPTNQNPTICTTKEKNFCVRRDPYLPNPPTPGHGDIREEEKKEEEKKDERGESGRLYKFHQFNLNRVRSPQTV